MEHFDKLDLDILRLIVEEPRAGVREYARRLNIARNTAQARITKLENSGVIVTWRPQINPAPLGYPVAAYVHVHIMQRQFDQTIARLETIPELIEANTVAGEGDLLCRFVARDNGHLEEVLRAVLETQGVVRIRSEIVLNRRLWPRVIPLIEKLRPHA
ncbi:Lrp/AsnC family transcriptional regulator [Nocardia sp. CA2R105]|uniref:Lrp/AsnC family transcriptional regulator n=1 Tax=Nocardia coffeae TaxID=2873381 RepID=UPI001CA6A2A4|nr:Lrp/AsnC family transcriptional regulator [Nocardia coffeae]MBY8862347.1 Lrp/AsnC family transcriptional regulator [Nocardia coffeae]